MKRTLAFILAALLLASSVVSCGNGTAKETQKAETKAVETESPETNAPATNAPETEAPVPVYSYDTSLITENGVAKAHIVLAEGADPLLTYAAEELVYHIKKVTGADIAVVNTAAEDSLPIILATPETHPELETLFADDLTWLRDLGEIGTNVRWGDDGFAIRAYEGKIYIFGAVEKGTLNGVYDFIEENLGVLWIRSNEENGIIYDEMPTTTVLKTDYREKSPFGLRGWTLGGCDHLPTQIMFSRNKLNGSMTVTTQGIGWWKEQDAIGIEPFISNHNIKWWITNSPSYDASCTEYWSTSPTGEHVSHAGASQQINFWSDVTMQCIADHVISFLDQYKEAADIDYVGLCLEDIQDPSVYPEMTEPYEYEPGKTVSPTDDGYISTVFFSFMNKIARIVGEKYPDVILHTYAYGCVEVPPVDGFVLEDNLYVTYCSYNEDLNTLDRANSDIVLAWINNEHLEGWMKITKNIQVYSYYGCCTALPIYGRPIYDRIQIDLQYYAENGFNGTVPEGLADRDTWLAYDGWADHTPVRCPYLTYDNEWTMNALTFWLYSKLCWNPYEDVEALIDYYCEKVYGDAAPYMREYYDLIEAGWAAGRETLKDEFNNHMKFNRLIIDYWDLFIDIDIDGESLYEKIQAALNNAWDAADDKAKEHIRYMRDLYSDAEPIFIG